MGLGSLRCAAHALLCPAGVYLTDCGVGMQQEDPDIRIKTVGYSDKPYFDGVMQVEPCSAIFCCACA